MAKQEPETTSVSKGSPPSNGHPRRTKTCRECLRQLPIAEFDRDPHKWDGLDECCRGCNGQGVGAAGSRQLVLARCGSCGKRQVGLPGSLPAKCDFCGAVFPKEQVVLRCSACGTKQVATRGSRTARCVFCGAPFPRVSGPRTEAGNAVQSGVLVVIAIFLVLVFAAIGYVVVMALFIGGMAKDAVPGGGLDNLNIPTVTAPAAPATSVPPRPSGTATTQGADCRSGFMLSFPTGADLRNCALPGAYLPLADFTGSDLSGANLSYAYLDGANFTGANLAGANLAGARLTDVIWSNTTCPDGTNSDGHANTCVGYGV